MNDTISMIINQTRQELINTCNKSGLPPCILEILIKNMCYEIESLAREELLHDTKNAQYNEPMNNVSGAENISETTSE